MTAKLIRPTDPVVVPPPVVVIYGDPGVRKTTTACTSETPIIFAFDPGYYRSKHAALGVPAITFDTWDDCLDYTKAENLTEHATIILDTAGSLLDLITVHLLEESSKNGRGDGSLSLKGFGALGTAFETYVSRVRAMKKTLVIVSHAKEEKDGEETRKRLDIKGQGRDLVCKVADLVGYMTADDRGAPIIHWDPTTKWFAKSPSLGTMRVPNVLVGDVVAAGPARWLGDLLAGVRATFTKVAAESTEIANVVMEVQATLQSCDTDIQLTQIALGISAKKPSVALGAQLRRLVADRAKELELAWDKKANRYVAAVEASAS